MWQRFGQSTMSPSCCVTKVSACRLHTQSTLVTETGTSCAQSCHDCVCSNVHMSVVYNLRVHYAIVCLIAAVGVYHGSTPSSKRGHVHGFVPGTSLYSHRVLCQGLLV